MSDPCEATVVDPPITFDMYTSVFGVLDEKFMKPGNDTVSENHGDKLGVTYCGDRDFFIVSVTPVTPHYSNFLTIEMASGQVIAQSSDQSHVGNYTVTI